MRPNIIFEGKRAVGVRYCKGGRGGAPVEVRARQGGHPVRRHLQLAAAAAIVGHRPAGLLQSLGIAVRHALPGVGEGLQDHYAPRSVARVKNIKTINERRAGPQSDVGGAQMGDERRGILSLSPTMVYCFWHSGESPKAPTCS